MKLKFLQSEKQKNAADREINAQYRIASWAASVSQMLKKAGVVDAGKNAMFTAVSGFETGGWDTTKSNFADDKNLFAVKFINNPKIQKATKGRKAADGSFFAKYETWQDSVNDGVRVLSLGGVNSPANAQNLQDFVLRLQKNNYFGKGDPTSYLRGMQFYLKNIPIWQNKVDASTIVTTNNNSGVTKSNKELINSNWFNQQDWYVKLAIIGGSALVVVAIFNSAVKK